MSSCTNRLSESVAARGTTFGRRSSHFLQYHQFCRNFMRIAVGVGATMTLAMDIRLASEKSRFGLVFDKKGIVPDACSSWFLPRAVGLAKALKWTYSGEIPDVRQVLAGGLSSSSNLAYLHRFHWSQSCIDFFRILLNRLLIKPRTLWHYAGQSNPRLGREFRRRGLRR